MTARPEAVSSAEERSGAGLSPQALAAYETFYRDRVPKLTLFLILQGASPWVATEVVQETMIKVFKRWSAIDAPAAWARTVASREYIRFISRVEEEPLDWNAEASVMIAKPDEINAVAEESEILALLRMLPQRQRQVMAWSYDGCTPAEIAEELQITPEAVRSSLHQARRAVARQLDQQREIR